MLPYSFCTFLKCHPQQTSHYFENCPSQFFKNALRVWCFFEGYLKPELLLCFYCSGFDPFCLSDASDPGLEGEKAGLLAFGRDLLPFFGIYSSMKSGSCILFLALFETTAESKMNDVRSGTVRVPLLSALSEAFGLPTVCLCHPHNYPQMYWQSYSFSPSCTFSP